ncbi:UPF0187-domain-containing protein [Sporormia fimetaria CBS 119925]|uniref:UPF0187-domain-containing protein n=1 Tax=Sporormia fimetaria CBS 119925 TaxID=1340428 RepID=A0A6A6V7Y3_9PLEO|nr:UPF0187-domain-containing protein [Sporormia fimetaria CBS 119925]
MHPSPPSTQHPSLHHVPTYPLSHAHRRKPRRIPLVLRFAKGAIHGIILVPVLWHSIFTALIVYFDRNLTSHVSIPSTIIPSLSIVVGLMLVFRNSTSYDRFWTGRQCLGVVGTCVRNLVRVVLVAYTGTGTSGSSKDAGKRKITPEEKEEVESFIRACVAVLYAVKHNLRAEYNVPDDEPLAPRPSTTTICGCRDPDSTTSSTTLSASMTTADPERAPLLRTPSEYHSLLPSQPLYEHHGLSAPLQLTILLERFIERTHQNSLISAPLHSSLTGTLNTLIDAYTRMETIRSTPLPIAHLIHGKQVLALYMCVLPFAMVESYGWYSVGIVGIVAFTLYGIDGIGTQLEDPFGYDRNDIKMDGIVEDWRVEVEVMCQEWRKGVNGGGGLFG